MCHLLEERTTHHNRIEFMIFLVILPSSITDEAKEKKQIEGDRGKEVYYLNYRVEDARMT